MKKLRTVVFLSGGGRTLQNLIDKKDELPINIHRVVCNNPNAYGIVRAQQHNIPVTLIGKLPGKVIFEMISDQHIDLILLAGWNQLLAPIPKEFESKILNIHPSLLPAFGGKGFYGDRIHKKVLDRGVKITGCTVHYVDEQYDHGKIIVQKVVYVKDNDTIESLAAKVFEQEKLAYPEAIQFFYKDYLNLK